MDRPIIFSAPMVRALLDGRKTQTRRVLKLRAIMGNMTSITAPEESAIELEPGEFQRGVFHYESTSALSGPYPIGYTVGDRLWVREAWNVARCTVSRSNPDGGYWRWDREELGDPRPYLGSLASLHYAADGEDDNPTEFSPCKSLRTGKVLEKAEIPWRPSIHMFRWASRITLTVTDVRVQRLQEITHGDCYAEGLDSHGDGRFKARGEAVNEWPRGEYGGEGYAQDGWGDARMVFADLWCSIHGPAAWDANPWVVALTFTVERRNIDAKES